MRSNNILIPTRFLVTIGHLIAMVLAQETQMSNISAALGVTPTANSLSTAESYLTTLFSIAYVSFFFDFLSLLLGLTIFFPKINLFHIITHFCGSLYVSWYVAYEWEYETLLFIVLAANVSSMVLEIFMIIAIFGVKIIVY